MQAVAHATLRGLKPCSWMSFVQTCRSVVLILVLALFGWLPATSQAGGVLLRLRADRALSETVFVDLIPPDARPVTVQLRDDGRNPDVSAGDGLWAGALSLPYAEVQVDLLLGEQRFVGETVSWPSANVPRDIDLVLEGSTLSASARQANVHGEEHVHQEVAPGSGDASGGASGPAPNTGAGPSPVQAPGVAATTNTTSAGVSSDDTSLPGIWFIGIGAVALAAMMGLVLTRRKVRVVPAAAHASLVLHPAGGFAGEGSPLLNNGLLYWVVDEAERDEALVVLTRMLSRHHNVLVVGSSELVRAGDAGRAIHCMALERPALIGDAVEVLHQLPRQPGVAVYVGVDGSPDDWAMRDDELPDGAGGIVFCTPTHAGPPATHRVRLAGPGRLVIASLDGASTFVVSDRSAA